MNIQKDYKGAIIEESLVDNRLLNNLEIINLEITTEENPAERWHIFKVHASKDDIDKLSKNINDKKWYMHFWKGKDVILCFQDKKFEFNRGDENAKKQVIDYGISIGIPREQLNFFID
ncbi:MAG: hypothetical protein Q8N28_02045 [bacterium]|nr:hypothetical protein [bacterium]